jgi:hypothetical protein
MSQAREMKSRVAGKCLRVRESQELTLLLGVIRETDEQQRAAISRRLFAQAIHAKLAETSIRVPPVR